MGVACGQNLRSDEVLRVFCFFSAKGKRFQISNLQNKKKCLVRLVLVGEWGSSLMFCCKASCSVVDGDEDFPKSQSRQNRFLPLDSRVATVNETGKETTSKSLTLP
ncbi:unnamed protein product [Ectocarpus sp. 4 AP-2014]